MKSLEVKFNEALAELKKRVSKEKYDGVCQQYMPLATIEAKLNCVEAALGTLSESANPLKLENIDEAKRDYAVLFGVEPKTHATTKEKNAQPIKKHNGPADNFVEGSPLNGDRGKAFTNTATRAEVSKGDKALADGLLKLGKITEAEHAKLVGKKPAGYEKLNEGQRKEFEFARMIGLSEVDAFRVVNITGGYKEVSRR
jgi:hypothetical protein